MNVTTRASQADEGSSRASLAERVKTMNGLPPTKTNDVGLVFPNRDARRPQLSSLVVSSGRSRGGRPACRRRCFKTRPRYVLPASTNLGADGDAPSASPDPVAGGIARADFEATEISPGLPAA